MSQNTWNATLLKGKHAFVWQSEQKILYKQLIIGICK